LILYKPYNERIPDQQYPAALKRIRDHGELARTLHGEASWTIVGLQMRFMMEDGFPLLTQRDLSRSFKGALGELIGFAHGAHTLEELKSYGCPKVFWEQWVTAEKCADFGLPEHELGAGSYGPGWAANPMPNGGVFNQIEHLMRQIRERPYLRTHFLSPWIPMYTLQHSELQRNVVVAPCHGWVHFVVFPLSKKLTVHHFQRSGDMPVGVALNLVEYAALGMLVARMIDYTFTQLVYTISDAHIYESEMPYVEKLLQREPRAFPTVTLDEAITDPMDARREHFTLADYDPHPHMVIPTPV
jgi:thymidylate synthase